MKEKGQLVLVVSIILFLFILGGIILSLIPPENLMVRRQVESNQAFYISQAGLQNAVYLINTNKDLANLQISSEKTFYSLNVTYTITETSGTKITGSYEFPISLGEYTVSAVYTNALINEGGILSQGDFFIVRSIGYVPSITNYSAKRTIEIYGRVDEISLDAFRYTVFAGRSVEFKGRSAVIEGERLPDGTFDTAIYSRGNVDLNNPPSINGTYNPVLGRDVIANDSSIEMPRLNETYLRTISIAQGLYRTGNNIDLKDLVNIAQSNPNWYNASTKTYNTWSLVIYIDGSAKMSGNVEFQGMVIVKGSLRITGTGNKIKGIVYAVDMDTVPDDLTIYGDPIIEGSSIGEVVDIGGNSTLKHRRDYINNILLTHGIPNVVEKTRGNLKILSWREY